MPPKIKPKLIGVAGGSGSGKSTLCRLLSESLGAERVGVLLTDNYYRAQDEIPFEERTKVNYDHPSALELDLLHRHLALLAAGSAIEMPEYDFALHTRRPKAIAFESSPVVLVDGIFALFEPSTREQYFHKIFVDAPETLRLNCRLARDVAERGRTKESVLAQWANTVEPMYQKLCYPTRTYADTVLCIEALGLAQFDGVIAKLTALIGRR